MPWQPRKVLSLAGLSAQLIGQPVPDQLLDGLAVCQLLVQCLARELRELGIARETQTDELVDGEVIDARLQVAGRICCRRRRISRRMTRS
jgi:hypothetical protein